MLSIYAGSHMSMVHNNSGDPELRVIGNESIEGTEIEGDLSDGPIANIMFIGDSVDRHILQYLCQHVGGTVRGIVLRNSLRFSGSDDPCAPASQAERSMTISLSKQSNGGKAYQTSPLTSANVSGCVVNTCSSPLGRVRLLATYIPGVHPSGPYHKGRRLGFRDRIDQANKIWRKYSSSPPDLVVVSSLLWDIARLHAYEPNVFSASELSLEWLQSWMSNFSQVVSYARQTVGVNADLFLYHTAMMPRFNPISGSMDKEYLGKAVFIRQLNAAGMQAATALGMEIMDYTAMASRFLEGQTYLHDQIHPGPEVGLEVANMLLNYVGQVSSRRNRVTTG